MGIPVYHVFAQKKPPVLTAKQVRCRDPRALLRCTDQLVCAQMGDPQNHDFPHET